MIGLTRTDIAFAICFVFGETRDHQGPEEYKQSSGKRHLASCGQYQHQQKNDGQARDESLPCLIEMRVCDEHQQSGREIALLITHAARRTVALIARCV
jgi:hypothetical protein